MDHLLKTEYIGMDAREALRASPSVLLGVSAVAAAALRLIEVETVFDLATSRLFANASRLLKAGQDARDAFYRFGAPPKDIVRSAAEGRAVDELRFESIAILEGLDDANAATLAKSLDVQTVRDLALWPPYLAAQRILDEAYFPEKDADFDREAPADLLPKSGEYPTERVFYHTLVLDQVGVQADQPLEQADPIDIAPTLDQSFGFKHLGIGALITMSQSWYAQGVALGQLLHSTALAPGESTRLAVMDWSRRTKAGVTEVISEREQLDNETMHSRSLSEVTKAVANEAQEGFSSTSATSTAHQKGKSVGGATINADPINALTGGLFGDDPGVTTKGSSESESTVTSSGMTFTSSSGNRSLEASMTQKVMDRTQQHANSVRNRRASIIREVSQEEHQSVSTRVITNYNHMHALSIQYYEVVQIYRVEVGISDIEKCIFIPMKLVDFTQTLIDRYRLTLAQAALDRKAYELLTTRYGVVEVMPQTPRLTPNKLLAKIASAQIARTVLREELFSLAFERPVAPPVQQEAKPAEKPAVKETLNIRPTMVDVLSAKGYDLAQIDYAAKVIGRGVVRPDSDSLFLPDDAVITGILARDGLATKIEAKVRGENTRIGIGSDGVSLTQALPVTEIEAILLTSGKEEEQTITLALQCNYLGVAFPLTIKVRLAGGSGAQEVIRFGGVRASKDLIEHLNANKLHYSQAIYRSLDASSLALLLSPYSYKGKPVVQLIDPTPVTIAGNYLVFKMHEEEYDLTEDGERMLSSWGQWLRDHGISRSRVKTELIPLPSGGVFAEAVLGRYNAAEKLDMTRFWNWQDSPIPFGAPEIAPVQMDSRGTTEDLKPGQLGAPVVSIVNPTALPEPTGMAGVLQAIQNGNMFRDMSGLAATMSLTQAALNAASQGATAAGAQAGTNAATAAQLFSELIKTAASVAAMAFGGPLGGAAAGGLLGSGGGDGGNSGGNISNAGALVNQGRSLAERGRSSADTGVGGTGIGVGDAAVGAGGNNNSPSNSGGGAPSDPETQAFNRALWGPAGESQSDMLRGILQNASAGEAMPLSNGNPNDYYVIIYGLSTSGTSRVINTPLGVNPGGRFNNAVDVSAKNSLSLMAEENPRLTRHSKFRWRQTVSQTGFQKVANAWRQEYHSIGSLPDDPDPQLQIGPDERGWLRMFDSPGWPALVGASTRTLDLGGGNKSSPQATEVVVKMLFQTWVEGLNASGAWERVSQVLDWCSIQWLKRANANANWQPTADSKIVQGAGVWQEFAKHPEDIGL